MELANRFRSADSRWGSGGVGGSGATFVFRIEENPGREGRVPAIAPAGGTSDTAAVARVVANFHAAIGRADSVAALSLLATDVSIKESGDVERLSGYRAHHLAADIAFARAVPPTNGALRVTVGGDAAWVTSTSATRGSFKGRAVNSSVHTGHPGARLRALATCLRALGHPHLLARVGARAADVDTSLTPGLVSVARVCRFNRRPRHSCRVRSPARPSPRLPYSSR